MSITSFYSYNKLATSNTLEGITDCVNKFYTNTPMKVSEDGTITRISDGKVIESTHVTKRKGRYIFKQK